jgi:hypothetical protein
VWDVQRARPGRALLEPDGDTVITMFYRYLDLDLRKNQAHDWVEGNYEPGHTLYL